jgi:fibronectin-binding autotransporter adhesin
MNRFSPTTALRAALFALIGLATASTASAGTITTWSGTAANNNWSTNGNWTTKPTTSGTFSLVYLGSTASGTSANNVGPVDVDSILFNNNGTAGRTSSYRLSTTSTSSIRLADGASVTTTAVTSGTLTDNIAGSVVLLGTGTFNIGGNHNLTLSGTVSNSGSLVKTGDGNLLLTGSATLGGLTVSQGIFQVNSTSYEALNGLQVGVGSVGNTGNLYFSGVSGTSSTSLKMGGNAVVWGTRIAASRSPPTT